MTGRVHSLESFGSVDGPGIRFVVFLQGCPLRCAYCHNPDAWAMNAGTEMEAEELFRKIRRYKTYFGETGGVTVSGGEALMQPEFVTELFRLCHADGINTCLDTSGCVLDERVMALLDETDTVLLDIKMTTEEDYREYTGGSLRQTMDFLRELHRRKIPTWIRQVIVEGFNDTEENVARLNELIAPYDNITRVELLPFHTMCRPKYEKLGIEFRFGTYPDTRSATVERLQKLVKLPSAHSQKMQKPSLPVRGGSLFCAVGLRYRALQRAGRYGTLRREHLRTMRRYSHAAVHCPYRTGGAGL